MKIYATYDRAFGPAISAATCTKDNRYIGSSSWPGWRDVIDFSSGTVRDINQGAGGDNLYLHFYSPCTVVDSAFLRSVVTTASKIINSVEYTNDSMSIFVDAYNDAMSIINDLSDGYTTSAQEEIDNAAKALESATKDLKKDSESIKVRHASLEKTTDNKYFVKEIFTDKNVEESFAFSDSKTFTSAAEYEGYSIYGYKTDWNDVIGDEYGSALDGIIQTDKAFVDYSGVDSKYFTFFYTPNKSAVKLDNKNADKPGSEKIYAIFNNAYFSDESYDKKISLSENIEIPYRKGYIFDGYYDSENSNVQMIDSEGCLTLNAYAAMSSTDTTWFARWTPIAYTLKFHANEETNNDIKNVVCIYDVPIRFNDYCLKQTGFTFLGWSRTNNGDVEYNNESVDKNLSEINNDVIDLYAKWQRNKYILKYDGNGAAEGSIEPVECAFGSTIKLAENAFVRDNCIFVGWSTKNTGDAEYSAGDTVKNLTEEDGQTVTLYAIWKMRQSRITFVNWDGTVLQSSDVEWGTVPVYSGETPVREKTSERAYVFSGWDKEPTAVDGEAVYTAQYTEKYRPEKLVGVNAVGDYERIIISWSKAAEAETNLYVVYRRADGEEDFSQLGTVSGRETLSYTDTSAEEDVNYSYYVTARTCYGLESEPSDIASAACAKDTEPPVVTKITPSTNTFISRTQKIKVCAVDNVAPVHAELWYSVDDGEHWYLIGKAIFSPFTFYFDTAAIADGVVLVKAVVYDKAGNRSEPKTVKYAVDNTGLEKVTGLKARVIYSSKITLEWDDVSSNDAASFILQRKTDGGFVNISSTVTTLGYNLSGLTPATSYTYRVAAVDNCGNVGEYSDELTVSTLADTSAPVVTKLAPAPARYSKYVNFSATASDDCDIKTITIQYSFDRETWTDASSKTFTYASSSQTYGCMLSFADFDDGSVFVRAVATDSSGNVSDSSASAPFVEYYVDHTPPAMPTGFTATGGDGYIYLKWNTGDEIDLGKYQLTRADSADGNYLTIASALTTVDFYDRNVTEGHTYYYKLRVADTANNDSEYTDWVSAQPLVDTVKPIVNSISPVSGSVVGPAARGIGVLASDNGMLGSLTVEYRTSADSVFKTLATVENIGSYYKNYTVNLPLDEMNDGDTVYVRARCTDTAGLVSDYSKVYSYKVDKTAPVAADAAAVLDGAECLITWKNDSSEDISGFKVYRVASNGYSVFVGSRTYRAGMSYSITDSLESAGAGEYTYRIDAYDKYGNSSQTDAGKVAYNFVHIDEKAPIARITYESAMEVGVEEYFDGGKSTDDNAVVSYTWDFGDGTYSSEKRPVKKYSAVGTYTVTLTVTDSDGLSGTASVTVTVRERTELGTLEVTVVDENNRTMAYAPVYFDLGSDRQQTVYANASGVARLVLPHGEHLVGVYQSGYLPAQRNVTVIANTVRKTTLTLIKQEIVTGEFEVKRMTFDEIIAAGFDISKPENQNLYSVSLQITYGASKVPLRYIRNNYRIIRYEVGDVDGRHFDIVFIPNKQNEEIVAVIDIPVKASYLKEFFDVKLFIINNAAVDFELVDNTVELNVPNGLTVMTGLPGNWCESSTVYIDSIKGLETKTLSWVLRGDVEGEYNLSADYIGTLDRFNETVSATFVTEDPIRVYGLSNVGIEVEVCDEIKYNAVYFNVGIKNIGSADVHNPQLDFDGIVSNITASVKAQAGEKEDGSADFDVEASLLNVKYVNTDGKAQYIPFSWTDNGTVHVDIETLAPGESVSYEYAAYNLIDYDEIAYFGKAAKEVLSGYTENVSVVSRPFDLYNTDNAAEKLETALSTVSDAGKLGQLDYDVSDVTYYPSFTSAVNGKTYTDGDLPFIYDDCFFNRKATDGVNNGLAAASANLAAAAYSDASTVKAMLEDMGYSVVIMKNYSASDIGAKTDYVAYTVSEKKVGETSVLVVSVRGTSSYDEWNSNFNIGKNGKYHEGFNNAANEVMTSISQYFEGAGLDKEHTKIWITGHSRGAAVANIVAERLTKEAKYATADNIYAYTYACPNTSTSADTSLSNIYNYCDGDDLVASVPFASWGFKRAGKTFDFSMAGGAQTVFRSITGKAYSGSKACTEFSDAVAEIASDANEYYSLGLNEIMGEVAKLLSDKSVDVGVIRNNLLKIAAGRPAQVVNAVNKAIALFIDGSGIDSVCHAHCPETYISYVAAAYPTGQIVTTVKKNRGDTTPKFNVSKNNALEYILNDGNYLYVTNTDWIARISEQAFNALKLATLDFEVITKEKQKKLAQTVILQLLTDSNFNADIDTLIDVQYLKTVKTVLGAIKNTVSLPDNTEFLKNVNAILANRSTLNSLATALKLSGSEALSSELIKSFAGSMTEAGAMQAIKLAIASNCAPDSLAAELLGDIGTLAGCTASALDTLILKPAQLYNSVEYAKYVHGLMNFFACSYEANLILDTLIGSGSKQLMQSVFEFCGYCVISPSLAIMNEIDVDPAELVSGVAEEMKAMMTTEFNAELETLKQAASDVIRDGTKKLLKSGIKALLGKANVWYLLFTSVFKIIDSGFGISDYFGDIDTYNIITYVSSALAAGYYARATAFENYDGMQAAMEIAGLNYSAPSTDRLAADALYLLKALCNTRLVGEKAYKAALEKNNSTWLTNDADHDYNIIKAANERFGTSCGDVETLYDYIYGNILSARDIIFNIENASEVDRPAAPEVTVNYSTDSTDQAFDSTYEYCFSDGEWQRCTGGVIPVKVKTHPTVLRVRKASGNGNPAGEITTVTVYARRSLSKTVTARFDNGRYYFTNLSADRTYAFCPVSGEYAGFNDSERTVVSGGFGANAPGKQARYIAIKSLANDALFETESEILYVKVNIKHKLTVIREGNGSVAASASDFRWFIGDEAVLTASPSSGETFIGWYKDAELLGTGLTYAFDMYEDARITAKFSGDTMPESVRIIIADAEEPNYAGFKKAFRAEILPENAADKSVTWSTSESSVASVAADGTVTFVSPGTAKITVTAVNGITDEVSVDVVEDKIIGIKIEVLPDKTEFTESETFNSDGMTVAVFRESGKTELHTDFVAEPFGFTAGKQTAKVTYAGFEDSYSFSVKHGTFTCETVAPTCVERGFTKFTCDACGFSYCDTFTDALGHDMGEWVVTVSATCTEDGERCMKCTVCGTVLKTEAVPAHGHADADKNGKCDNCGESLTSSCKHICHSKNRLAQFFWKMLRLMYKLFKNHEFCDCGVRHW
ncbi:MAG: PKD domain-containing protein [Oscillospiraceae bacterium]|nr:PKD domain-containing protein [Oscillospiraceae bacterium]